MSVTIITGDCRDVLRSLASASVQTCVTSPPYFGLRDYGRDGQIGLEQTPDVFVEELVAVFREVRRVLRNDGTLWLNLGDSYARNGGGVESKMNTVHKMGVGQKSTYLAGGMQTINKVPLGYKAKDLLGIPWRVAFALQADGWYLRQDIIWHKPNPMPESVTDRCTKAHEYVFLLSKSERYYFNAEAIAEEATGRDPGNVTAHKHAGQPMAETKANLTEIGPRSIRNKRSVWTVPVRPFSGAHFATFPPDLIDPCIQAGSRVGDTVLDPFGGAGTTGLVADRLNRHAILIELNPAYVTIANHRLADDAPLFADVVSV
jgi:DNA modification methylase